MFKFLTGLLLGGIATFLALVALLVAAPTKTLMDLKSFINSV